MKKQKRYPPPFRQPPRTSIIDTILITLTELVRELARLRRRL